MILCPPFAELAELLFIWLGHRFVSVGSLKFALAAQFGGFDDPLLRGLVFAKLAYKRSTETPCRKGDDLEAQPEITADDFEDVSGLEITARFDRLCAEGDVAFRAGLSGEAAAFEDADVVEPFVDSLRFGCGGHVCGEG